MSELYEVVIFTAAMQDVLRNRLKNIVRRLGIGLNR